jgi:hypothetical protein
MATVFVAEVLPHTTREELLLAVRCYTDVRVGDRFTVALPYTSQQQGDEFVYRYDEPRRVQLTVQTIEVYRVAVSEIGSNWTASLLLFGQGQVEVGMLLLDEAGYEQLTKEQAIR